MAERSEALEVLSAALSAYVSEFRLYWRGTGISCRWLVPDGCHCYADEDMIAQLRAFRNEAESRIVSPEVLRQWKTRSASLLDGESSPMPFDFNVLTWLLRVWMRPETATCDCETCEPEMWEVKRSDFPSPMMRDLVNYGGTVGAVSLNLQVLSQRVTAAVASRMPSEEASSDGMERAHAVKFFDHLRRFKNLVFYGIANIGKGNLSKQIIRDWERMTGRRVGMHCVTACHRNLRYEDVIERRMERDMPMSRAMIDDCAPRVIARYMNDEQYFFEPFGGTGVQDGLFLSLCRAAAYQPQKDFIFMLDRVDEIRLDDMFGEVAQMLDSYARVPWRSAADGGPGAWNLEAEGARSIRLSQSGRIFFIPANVYILGTADEARLFETADALLFNAFALEYMPTMSAESLRRTLLCHRTAEEFARLERYVEHSVKLWGDIHSVFVRVGGEQNGIGYCPLIGMCEEILRSGDVQEANRMALDTWRYRMMPLIRAKMMHLLACGESHRAALDELLNILNCAWLRLHVDIQGLPGSASIDITYDPDCTI